MLLTFEYNLYGYSFFTFEKTDYIPLNLNRQPDFYI